MTNADLLALITENAQAMRTAADAIDIVAERQNDPTAHGIALGYRETATWLLALVDHASKS
jgi:hypothetical protein